jgi:hypothetical protein
MLPIYATYICYLYSILYFYYLSYICTFIWFFLHIWYLYVYTYTYLVSYTILCQYSPHTPDRTHPQGAGGRGGRENPHYIYPLIYLLYMYILDIWYIYICIYPLLTYLPHRGEGQITGIYIFLYTPIWGSSLPVDL